MIHARRDYDMIQDPSGKIPIDEPVFLLRAQDRYAADILRMYAAIAAEDGAGPEIVGATLAQAARMDAWPTKKQPDMPPSAAHTPPAPPPRRLPRGLVG